MVEITSEEQNKVKSEGKSLSHARLLTTPWTAAHQAPPPMGLSSQEYWNGVPLPSLKLIHRQTVNKLQNVNYKEVF